MQFGVLRRAAVVLREPIEQRRDRAAAAVPAGRRDRRRRRAGVRRRGDPLRGERREGLGRGRDRRRGDPLRGDRREALGRGHDRRGGRRRPRRLGRGGLLHRHDRVGQRVEQRLEFDRIGITPGDRRQLVQLRIEARLAALRDGAQPLHQPPQDLLDGAPATLLGLHLAQRVEVLLLPVDGFGHVQLTQGRSTAAIGRGRAGLSSATPAPVSEAGHGAAPGGSMIGIRAAAVRGTRPMSRGSGAISTWRA